MTAGELAQLGPDALPVNTSRARDPTDPLLTWRTSSAHPHIGYVTREEWEVQFSDIFDQINAYADGTPINVVNPDVLAHARSRP